MSYEPYPWPAKPAKKEPETIPQPTRNPGDGEATARELIYRHFAALKTEGTELERLISVLTPDCAAYGLTEKDLKRLDKAVTVMKVGMKIVKKVARRELKRADRAIETAV